MSSDATPASIATDSCPDPTRIETARLADQLERSLRGGAWHGPSLLEAVEGIDAEAAERRPVAGAHTIAEIVGHAAFWIDAGRRRIGGEAVSEVPPALNFPPQGAASASSWQATLAALDEAHRRLHATLLALDDDRLDGAVAGSDPTVRGLLLGILQHNAYHAGQIVVLRKAGAGSGP